MKKLHKERDLTDDEIAHGLELFGGHEGKIKKDFDEWYKHNVSYHLLSEEQNLHTRKNYKHDELEEHEDPEEGVSLAMPEGTSNRIVWAFLLPLNGCYISRCLMYVGVVVGKKLIWFHSSD